MTFGQSIAFAAPSETPAPQLAASQTISIPDEAGMLGETFQGTNGKHIVLIQDAHANFSGQMAVAQILESLMKQYGSHLVLVEGSSRDVTLDRIKSVADADTWKIAAKQMLQRNVIAGEEYLNLVSDLPIRLQGIEDPALYEESVRIYAAVAAQRKDVLEHLHHVRIALERLKGRLYPREMLRYEEKLRSVNSEVERIDAVIQLSETAGIDWRVYPELVSYREHPENLTPNDITELMQRVETLSNDAYRTVLTDVNARKVKAIELFVELLERAFRAELTSEDFQMLEANEPDFDVTAWHAFVNEELGKLGDEENLLVRDERSEQTLQQLKRFYELVDLRDLAFVRNASQILESENVDTAFLIAGGYHTQHLKSLLAAKGYSYTVVTPNVTFETDKKLYEKNLMPFRSTLKQKGFLENPKVTASRLSGQDFHGVSVKILQWLATLVKTPPPVKENPVVEMTREEKWISFLATASAWTPGNWLLEWMLRTRIIALPVALEVIKINRKPLNLQTSGGILEVSFSGQEWQMFFEHPHLKIDETNLSEMLYVVRKLGEGYAVSFQGPVWEDYSENSYTKFNVVKVRLPELEKENPESPWRIYEMRNHRKLAKAVYDDAVRLENDMSSYSLFMSSRPGGSIKIYLLPIPYAPKLNDTPREMNGVSNFGDLDGARLAWLLSWVNSFTPNNLVLNVLLGMKVITLPGAMEALHREHARAHFFRHPQEEVVPPVRKQAGKYVTGALNNLANKKKGVQDLVPLAITGYLRGMFFTYRFNAFYLIPRHLLRKGWKRFYPAPDAGCPLCEQNWVQSERALTLNWTKGMKVVPNPFGILHREGDKAWLIAFDHIRQGMDKLSLLAMLRFTERVGEGYTVFFNGENAGASIPTHRHFHAISFQLPLQNTEFFPLESVVPARPVNDGVKISKAAKYPEDVRVYESKDHSLLSDEILKDIALLERAKYPYDLILSRLPDGVIRVYLAVQRPGHPHQPAGAPQAAGYLVANPEFFERYNPERVPGTERDTPEKIVEDRVKDFLLKILLPANYTLDWLFKSQGARMSETNGSSHLLQIPEVRLDGFKLTKEPLIRVSGLNITLRLERKSDGGIFYLAVPLSRAHHDQPVLLEQRINVTQEIGSNPALRKYIPDFEEMGKGILDDNNWPVFEAWIKELRESQLDQDSITALKKLSAETIEGLKQIEPPFRIEKRAMGMPLDGFVKIWNKPSWSSAEEKFVEKASKAFKTESQMVYHMVLDVVSAMAEFHKRGFRHRDLGLGEIFYNFYRGEIEGAPLNPVTFLDWEHARTPQYPQPLLPGIRKNYLFEKEPESLQNNVLTNDSKLGLRDLWSVLFLMREVSKKFKEEPSQDPYMATLNEIFDAYFEALSLENPPSGWMTTFEYKNEPYTVGESESVLLILERILEENDPDPNYNFEDSTFQNRVGFDAARLSSGSSMKAIEKKYGINHLDAIPRGYTFLAETKLSRLLYKKTKKGRRILKISKLHDQNQFIVNDAEKHLEISEKLKSEFPDEDLQSLGILNVIAVGTTRKGFNFMILESPEADDFSLEQLGKFSVSKVLTLFDRWMGKLGRLHRLGYVHRDIKSSNVILDENGEVWIIDLATLEKVGVLSETVLVATHTPRFEARNAPKGNDTRKLKLEATPALDVYALGRTLLYTFLEDSDNARKSFNNHMVVLDTAKIRSMLQEDLRGTDLVSLIVDMTAYEPQDRISLEEARDRIETLRNTLPEEVASRVLSSEPSPEALVHVALTEPFIVAVAARLAVSGVQKEKQKMVERLANSLGIVYKEAFQQAAGEISVSQEKVRVVPFDPVQFIALLPEEARTQGMQVPWKVLYLSTANGNENYFESLIVIYGDRNPKHKRHVIADGNLQFLKSNNDRHLSSLRKNLKYLALNALAADDLRKGASFLDGAAMRIIARDTANRDEVLKAWTSTLTREGILGTHLVAAPDEGLDTAAMDVIYETAYSVKKDLRVHPAVGVSLENGGLERMYLGEGTATALIALSRSKYTRVPGNIFEGTGPMRVMFHGFTKKSADIVSSIIDRQASDPDIKFVGIMAEGKKVLSSALQWRHLRVLVARYFGSNGESFKDLPLVTMFPGASISAPRKQEYDFSKTDVLVIDGEPRSFDIHPDQASLPKIVVEAAPYAATEGAIQRMKKEGIIFIPYSTVNVARAIYTRQEIANKNQGVAAERINNLQALDPITERPLSSVYETLEEMARDKNETFYERILESNASNRKKISELVDLYYSNSLPSSQAMQDLLDRASERAEKLAYTYRMGSDMAFKMAAFEQVNGELYESKVQQLMEELDSSTDRMERRTAAYRLGSIPRENFKKEDLKKVVELLKGKLVWNKNFPAEEYYRVRAQAARALGRIGTPEAIEALKEAYLDFHETEPLVRAWIESGLRFNNANFDQKVEELQQSLQEGDAIMDLPLDERGVDQTRDVYRGRSEYALALIYIYQGKLELAVEPFEKAVEHFMDSMEQKGLLPLSTQRNIAMLYQQLSLSGKLYGNVGNFSESKRRDALDIQLSFLMPGERNPNIDQNLFDWKLVRKSSLDAFLQFSGISPERSLPLAQSMTEFLGSIKDPTEDKVLSAYSNPHYEISELIQNYALSEDYVKLLLLAMSGVYEKNRGLRSLLRIALTKGSMQTGIRHVPIMTRNGAAEEWSRLLTKISNPLSAARMARSQEIFEMNRRGVVEVRKENLYEAERIFDEVLEISPNDPFALGWKGVILEGRGFLNEAKEFYERTLLQNGLNSTAKRGLESVLTKLAQSTGPKREYKGKIVGELSPNFSEDIEGQAIFGELPDFDLKPARAKAQNAKILLVNYRLYFAGQDIAEHDKRNNNPIAKQYWQRMNLFFNNNVPSLEAVVFYDVSEGVQKNNLRGDIKKLLGPRPPRTVIFMTEKIERIRKELSGVKIEMQNPSATVKLVGARFAGSKTGFEDLLNGISGLDAFNNLNEQTMREVFLPTLSDAVQLRERPWNHVWKRFSENLIPLPFITWVQLFFVVNEDKRWFDAIYKSQNFKKDFMRMFDRYLRDTNLGVRSVAYYSLKAIFTELPQSYGREFKSYIDKLEEEFDFNGEVFVSQIFALRPEFHNLRSDLGEASPEAYQLDNPNPTKGMVSNASAARLAGEDVSALEQDIKELRDRIEKADGQSLDTSGLQAMLGRKLGQLKGLQNPTAKKLQTQKAGSPNGGARLTENPISFVQVMNIPPFVAGRTGIVIKYVPVRKIEIAAKLERKKFQHYAQRSL